MTHDRFKPLLDREFLRGVLHYEFTDYLAEGRDDELKRPGDTHWKLADQIRHQKS